MAPTPFRASGTAVSKDSSRPRVAAARRRGPVGDIGSCGLLTGNQFFQQRKVGFGQDTITVNVARVIGVSGGARSGAESAVLADHVSGEYGGEATLHGFLPGEGE
jgi:hypothetical protein